jgi:hypothetical protein
VSENSVVERPQLGRPATDEKAQLKQQGLAFGRQLQTVLKSVAMYSVEHPAIERGLQQAFASLNALVKQAGQFTIGFVNHRLLVGSILTDDESLAQLEAEFTRRGIGTVTFAAGISQRDFRRALAALSTRPQSIEEAGGIQKLLSRDPVNGLRIQPARKPSEEEDIVLPMDAESYHLAQEFLGPGGTTGMLGGGRGLDLLCQAAGLERPGGVGGAEVVLEVAARAVQAALEDGEKDPRAILQALALWLEEMTPAVFLAGLPAEPQGVLRGRPAEEIATELVEDAAARWSAHRLAERPADVPAGVAEEEVARLLMRGLRATQVAERLLRKLGRFLQEAGLPPEVFERLRQSLEWHALSSEEQRERLLQARRFTETEFHRLVTYVRERIEEDRHADAIEVAAHYWDCVFASPPDVQTGELGRAPQLLRTLAGQPSLDLLRQLAGRIAAELLPAHAEDAARHRLAVSCLEELAHGVAPLEDFETIYRVGLAFEERAERDAARHSACCAAALGRLLTPSASERLVESFLANREGSPAAKVCPALLRWLGAPAGERVFQRLEEETSAPVRLRLIRLVSQLGPAAVEAARARLADPRWYVVRNACRVMSDLEDTRLDVKLGGALRHADPRVQRAAATAILRSSSPDRARVLAEALPSLDGLVLDQVLDELTLLKDPASVDGLSRLLLEPGAHKLFTLEKALLILSVIGSDAAVEALGRVLASVSVPPAVRRAARLALERSNSPSARRLLAAAPSGE